MKYFLFLLLPALAMTSCKKLQDPVFNGIENVQVNKIGLGSSRINLNMKWYNPNNSGAWLKEAEGDAWMDSSYLGHFKVDTMVTIPAESYFFVPVTLDADMKSLFKNSLAGFLKKEVLFSIKGEARAGKNGFYRKFPITYSEKMNWDQLFVNRNSQLIQLIEPN